MKWTEAVKLAKDRDWADLELRPTGKILTEEQLNYVLYYARHTSISVKEAVAFNEVVGKFLCLGDWFGGASFYFYFSDMPDNGNNHDFSYGKLGRIEFEPD